MSSDTTRTARTTSHAPWWKGTRGEWYVVIQVALIVLMLVGPRTWAGGPRLSFGESRVPAVAAILLMAGGAGLLLAGGLWLGRHLTPVPHPKDGATLVDTGPFGLVRHPMYAGGLLFAFGWAIYVRGPLTLGYAIVTLVFLDIKSRREERWLREAFAGYEAYQKRVRKLIPFVY